MGLDPSSALQQRTGEGKGKGKTVSLEFLGRLVSKGRAGLIPGSCLVLRVLMESSSSGDKALGRAATVHVVSIKPPSLGQLRSGRAKWSAAYLEGRERIRSIILKRVQMCRFLEKHCRVHRETSENNKRSSSPCPSCPSAPQAPRECPVSDVPSRFPELSGKVAI